VSTKPGERVTIKPLSCIGSRTLSFFNEHPPIRGNEVITEQLATAINGLTPSASGFVVELVNNNQITAAAIALETGRQDGDSAQAKSTWVVETVAGHLDIDIHHRLVRTTAHQLRNARRQCVHLRWRLPSAPEVAPIALPDGWGHERSVIEMLAPLPLKDRRPVRASLPEDCSLLPVDLRSHQNRELLLKTVEVNNRAFKGHPEQGRRTADDFLDTLSSDWCLGGGLFVAVRNDDVLGFVLMKCMPDRPAELYVVAVDASAAGLGLGRTLVHAGFDHAVHTHQSIRAQLFVDASNVRAQTLYQSMGFTEHRRQVVAYIQLTGDRPEVANR
jgi:mycothiol synthase